ncbi:ATP-grasp domain-containing protein [Propionivibrio soli]|uniref:ATP-grasp domain-containing protein n=1 Tax=Propionivibrio soli TaxID=2976531 RepID=UPI0021E865EB|nr:ATP-grasp domain-containing protein [Propionivibrio soli]
MAAVANKRLMILGAGPFQLPAIKKAAELGCHVVTVDNVPGNVGHAFAHQTVNVSTVDKDGVLRAARDLRIDGICTFSSDVAIPTVAYVCEHLGLPGARPQAADTMATKSLFRRFLKKNGFQCPDFVSGDSLDDVADRLGNLRPPVVVKPVDASGSRGVTRLDTLEYGEFQTAFHKAQGFSRSHTVCMETFVEGTEVGGDAILVEGRVGFIAITHKHMAGFVVTGHSLPTNIPPDAQARLIAHIEELCSALDYRSGPLNFDAIVSTDKVTMLEMSARNGGNGIPAVIERSTGVDVEKATIFLALGGTPTLPPSTTRRGAGSFVFGSPTGGRLESISSVAELKQSIPEVFLAYITKNIGDRVDSFEHNGNLVGFALFDCVDADDYERLTERIGHVLHLTVVAE